MSDVVLKAVSPTMEKGTLARWLVTVGSAVTRGQVLAEIETDKASVELESEHEGVVSALLVAAGTQDVPVGTVLARLSADAVEVPPVATPVKGPAALPQAAPSASTPPHDPAAPARTTPAEPPSLSQAAPPANREVRATPIARRLARRLGVDLARVQGSGDHGRITKRDLEALAPRLADTPRPVAPSAFDAPSAPARGVPHAVVQLSGMRRTIARRLSESKRAAPHFYMSMDAELDALLGLRGQLNARPRGFSASVNDFVIRALALALAEVTDANVQFGGSVLYRYERVDLAVAVAVPDGLFTPVLRDAANKSLATIATEMRDLAERARAGKLRPEEFEGGTFSLSNLGMFGVRAFEAVINPPQAGILAVGAAEKRVVPGADGGVRVATQATLTLSCDHRAIDGAVGAKLLGAVKRNLEDPLGLLV